jgi:hypothetical protein
LLGEWQEKDNTTTKSDVWRFEKSETNSYKLTIVEYEKEGQFYATLFRLKNDYFLDLIPAECNYATNQVDLISVSMFPGHLLMRVSRLEPELSLSLFNVDWLDKFLKKNPKAIAHRIQGKQILLTADTGELQRFVMKHLGEGELFEKSGEMIRRTGKAP